MSSSEIEEVELYNDEIVEWEIVLGNLAQPPLPKISEVIITDEGGVADMGFDSDPYENWNPPPGCEQPERLRRSTIPSMSKRANKRKKQRQ